MPAVVPSLIQLKHFHDFAKDNQVIKDDHDRPVHDLLHASASLSLYPLQSLEDQKEIIPGIGGFNFANWECGWYYRRLLHAVDLQYW